MFFLRTTESFDHPVRTLARALGVVIASVDYRLAPEFPFPAPLDDCEIATRYFVKNAYKWGVDARRVAIGGARPRHELLEF